jgi:hypothetical protein
MPRPVNARPQKNVYACWLGSTLGIIGAHNFFIGRRIRACTQLALTALSIISLGRLPLFVISMIWGLIEGSLIYNRKTEITSEDPVFEKLWAKMKTYKKVTAPIAGGVVLFSFLVPLLFIVIGNRETAPAGNIAAAYTPPAITANGTPAPTPIRSAATNAPANPTLQPTQRPTPQPTPTPTLRPTPVPTLPTSSISRDFTVLGRDIHAYEANYMLAFSGDAPGMMMGAEYVYGFYTFSNASGSVNFNLGSKYISMSGLFGPMDFTGAGSSDVLTIRGDGRELASFEVLCIDPLRQFDINIEGVDQLQISWNNGGWNTRFGVANIVLSAEDIAMTQLNTPTGKYNNVIVLGQDVNAYRLASMQAFSRAEPGMMMGAEYINGYYTLFNDNGAVFFNLNGQYKKMAGLFGPMDFTGVGTFDTLVIRGDGRLLASYEVLSIDPINTFDINVEGVNQISMSWGGGWNNRFGVANIVLSAEETVETSQNTPKGTFGDTAVLGQDINAYRLKNMQTFTRANPGLMMGAEYVHGYNTIYNQEGSVYFNLNSQYKSIAGLFGPMDFTVIGTYDTLTIRGDGKVLAVFESNDSSPLTQFEADVEGVYQLRLSWSGGWGNRFGISNMVLSVEDSPATQLNEPKGTFSDTVTLGQEINAYRLSNMQAFSRAAPGMMKGTEYTNGFSAIANQSGSVYFNLNGKYSYMTGLFGAMDGQQAREDTLIIQGDGRQLASFNVIADNPLERFDINIEGITHLRISWAGGWGNRFGVADITLSMNHEANP